MYTLGTLLPKIAFISTLLLLTAACSGGSESTDMPTPTPEVVEQFTVEGSSMETALYNGDVIDVHRYTAPVKAGDLIVFYIPTAPDRQFVKRVIAGPGQLVQFGDGTVKVDGDVLDEPYVSAPTECQVQLGCSFQVPPNDQPPVPSPGSSPISVAVPGKLEIDDSACETIACYFVLGDNRPNASDSRQGWFVPVVNIVGWVTGR